MSALASPTIDRHLEIPAEAETDFEAPPRLRYLSVRHTTVYRYDQPIERSSHRLPLRPVSDAKQRFVSHQSRLEPSAPLNRHETRMN